MSQVVLMIESWQVWELGGMFRSDCPMVSCSLSLRKVSQPAEIHNYSLAKHLQIFVSRSSGKYHSQSRGATHIQAGGPPPRKEEGKTLHQKPPAFDCSWGSFLQVPLSLVMRASPHGNVPPDSAGRSNSHSSLWGSTSCHLRSFC